MKKPFAKIVVVILAVGILLAGCGLSRSTLLGSWKEDTSGVVLEFKEDGRVIQSVPGTAGSAIEVGYQFLNDETINIIGTQSVYTYKVEGNTLTLTAEGQAITLSRVK